MLSFASHKNTEITYLPGTLAAAKRELKTISEIQVLSTGRGTNKEWEGMYLRDYNQNALFQQWMHITKLAWKL